MYIFQHHIVKRVAGMHSTTSPETVMDLNNKMMVQFIWDQLGTAADAEVDEDVRRMADLVADPFKPWK